MASDGASGGATGDAPENAWLGRVRRALLVGFAIVVGAGVFVEVMRFRGAPTSFTDAFSLSLEANVPTWYSSMLLFACAGALAANSARSDERWRWHWRVLAIVFVAMSLDEVAGFHERLNQFAAMRGPLYFGWVVPFAVVVLVLGVLYLPFLRALPRATRIAFIVAGAVYVGGALGVELALGAWTTEHGGHNLGYRLIDALEEAMEIAGASLFVSALLARLGEPAVTRA